MTLPGRRGLLLLVAVALATAFAAAVIASTIGNSPSGRAAHTMPGGAVMQNDEMPAKSTGSESTDGVGAP